MEMARWVPSIMLISRMAVNYKVEWCPWLRVVNLENLELDSELLGPLRDLYVFTTQSQRQSCMWGAAGIFPNPMFCGFIGTARRVGGPAAAHADSRRSRYSREVDTTTLPSAISATVVGTLHVRVRFTGAA